MSDEALLARLRHRQVRDRGAPLLAGESSAPPAGDQEVVAAELEQAIGAAMEAMPPRSREVFELSRTRGMKNAEIAAALGVTVKAVEANMGRALRVLRERLAPWLPGGDGL